MNKNQSGLNLKFIRLFLFSALTALGMVNQTCAAEQQATLESSAATESKKGHFLEQYLPTVKLSGVLSDSKEPLHRIYSGVGFTQRLLHGHVEWVNPYGIGYLKAGIFNNNDRPFGAQVGFRYPYHLTNTDGNGYYIGVYAGHLDNKNLDGEVFQPIGAGLDLSYVMLDRSRISTFSIGLGAAQGKEGKNGTKYATEPQIQFAYSLSLGVY